MDLTQIYALCIGCVFAFLLLYYSVILALNLVRRRAITFLLKHLIYPFLYRRSNILRPITRYHVFLQAFYWFLTLVCNTVGVQSLAEVGARAVRLSVINLVPLFLSG